MIVPLQSHPASRAATHGTRACAAQFFGTHFPDRQLAGFACVWHVGFVQGKVARLRTTFAFAFRLCFCRSPMGGFNRSYRHLQKVDIIADKTFNIDIARVLTSNAALHTLLHTFHVRKRSLWRRAK